MHCCCVSVMWCGLAMTEVSEAPVVTVPEKPLCPPLRPAVIPPSGLHLQLRRAVLAFEQIQIASHCDPTFYIHYIP